MNTILIIILICVSISIIALIWGIVLKLLSSIELDKQKVIESKEQIRLALLPKSHPNLLPFLPYPQAMQTLKAYVKLVFQRVYTSEILPSMMTDTGSIAYAAPSDIKYAEFIQKIVLQCMIHMDSYLRKSVYLYYNVREDQDKKDTGTKALTITIFMQVKGLLDSHIIGLIEKTEKALMPTGVPFIQAVKKLGTMEDIEILLQTHQKPPTSPKFSSPDGTGVITNL